MTKLINENPPYTINIVNGEIIECFGECYFFCPYELKETLDTIFTRSTYHADFRLLSVKLSEKVELEAWQKNNASVIEKEFKVWASKTRFTQPESAKGLVKINCTQTGVRLLQEKFKDAVLLPIVSYHLNNSIFLRPDQVNEAIHYLENYYSPKNKKLCKQAYKKSDDYHKPDVIMNVFDIFEFSQKK